MVFRLEERVRLRYRCLSTDFFFFLNQCIVKFVKMVFLFKLVRLCLLFLSLGVYLYSFQFVFQTVFFLEKHQLWS
jgi:hypothetical protein